MDNSEQILKQLRWIKWLTAVLALSFAVIAGSFVWVMQEMSRTYERASASSNFADRASTLLDEGKETEVLALAKEREAKFPKDAYVHWYRGKAYYQLGQLREALTALRQAQELAPAWRAEYTGPLIQAVEDKLAAKR
jgi:cytochrome c-type biogenesis protein CcmH/NrfG